MNCEEKLKILMDACEQALMYGWDAPCDAPVAGAIVQRNTVSAYTNATATKDATVTVTAT